MFPEEYQTYVNELGEILRTKDWARVKAFYLEWKDKMELAPLPPDDQFEVQMRQMICEFPSLSDLHAESRKWLLEHGYTVQIENASSESKPE